jgi:hypothetical protein
MPGGIVILQRRDTSRLFFSLAKLKALPKFEALAPIYFQDLP